jgi:hypothetical protein
MKRFLLVALFLTDFDRLAISQETREPFSITIAAVEGPPQSGLRIKITLKNTSDQEMPVTFSNGEPEMTYAISLRDDLGKFVAESPRYRKLLGKDKDTDENPRFSSGIIGVLKPGQKMDQEYITLDKLFELFEIKKTGKYTIQIERAIQGSGVDPRHFRRKPKTIVSNEIPITVVSR